MIMGADVEYLIYNERTGECLPPNKTTVFNNVIETEHGKITQDGQALELNPLPGLPLEVSNRLFSLRRQAETLARASGYILLGGRPFYKQGQKYGWSNSARPLVFIDAGIDNPSKPFYCIYEDAVWPLRQKDKNMIDAYSQRRTTGHHLHFGIEPNNKNKSTLYQFQLNAFSMIQLLDYYIALPYMLKLDVAQRQLEVERRTSYGIAGEYRLNEHGFEYRVLSNSFFDPSTIYQSAYNLIDKASNYYFDGSYAGAQKMLSRCQNILPSSDLQKYINQGTGDRDKLMIQTNVIRNMISNWINEFGK